MKFKRLTDTTEVSLDGNFGRTQMRCAIPSQQPNDALKEVLSKASLYYDFKAPRAAVADNIEVPHAPTVLSDERYVTPQFRALSQIHLANRGLDFTTPGVLEAAVPMLFGKTVYLNHDFSDVNDWVGVVSRAWWDAAGEASGGVPGINVETKVDAFLNYRIACGLMMTPPAINSMSLTVCFEFEYSHPEMAMESKWKFFDNLGEEIDGEIVRMIVTRITEIWEASFVFLGEDRLAKNLGKTGTDGAESFSAKAEEAAGAPPPNSNEEKTMKLTSEQKQKLGIEFDGEEVPATQIFQAAETLADRHAELARSTEAQALAELTARAEAGDVLVEEKRKDTLRLARLADLGSETGSLNPVIEEMIAGADVAKLQQLHGYYGKKTAERFAAPRGSMENSSEIDAAGNVAGDTSQLERTPKVGVL